MVTSHRRHKRKHHHSKLKRIDLPMATSAGDAAFLDALNAKKHVDPNAIEMQQLKDWQQGKTTDGSRYGAHMAAATVLDKGMDDARPEGGMSYAKLKSLSSKELADINARKEAAYEAATTSGQNAKGQQIDLKTVSPKPKAPAPTH